MNIENVVSAFIVLCFGSFLAGLGYCVKKILSHDASLEAVHADIENMKIQATQRERMAEENNRTLRLVHRMVVKIAAKNGIEIEEGGN